MKVIAAALALAFSVCAVIPPAFAGQFILNGQVAQHNVAELTSAIPWYTSLPEAQAAARQQGKMIFWMHMLGSLSGAT